MCSLQLITQCHPFSLIYFSIFADSEERLFVLPNVLNSGPELVIIEIDRQRIAGAVIVRKSGFITSESIQYLKKQAKELLRSMGQGKLADAQHTLANEYGFANWAKLNPSLRQFLSGNLGNLTPYFFFG